MTFTKIVCSILVMRNESTYLFENRIDAGKQLGQLLKNRQFDDPVILALPRGGVVVADEVAKILATSMDVVISRKIGAPGHQEFGIGAISEDEVARLNPQLASYFPADSNAVKETISSEKAELKRRIQLYRQGQPLANLQDRTVVVVDDGLATGVTALASAKFLRTLGPQKLILAVPVGPIRIDEDIRQEYDEVICLHRPQNLSSIGQWYHDFNQVEDDEVLSILHRYH